MNLYQYLSLGYQMWKMDKQFDKKMSKYKNEIEKQGEWKRPVANALKTGPDISPREKKLHFDDTDTTIFKDWTETEADAPIFKATNSVPLERAGYINMGTLKPKAKPKAKRSPKKDV